MAQGKLDEAVAEYREAIRLKPDLGHAHVNLGAILCDVKGKFAEADGRIPRGDPDQARPTPGPQQPRRRPAGQGKLDEAIAAYREAIRLKPDDAMAHSNLGNALRTRGSTRRRRPRTARRSGSGPTTPPPTTTWPTH